MQKEIQNIEKSELERELRNIEELIQTKYKEIEELQNKWLEIKEKLLETLGYMKVACPICDGNKFLKEEGKLTPCGFCNKRGYIYARPL